MTNRYSMSRKSHTCRKYIHIYVYDVLTYVHTYVFTNVCTCVCIYVCMCCSATNSLVLRYWRPVNNGDLHLPVFLDINPTFLRNMN